MKPLLRNLVAVVSTALLAACGGGGGGAPFQISNSQAVNALSNAKSSNNFFVTDLVNLSNAANPILALTASSWPSGTGSSALLNCSVSGFYSYSYSKAFSGLGLSTGDYYSVTYSGCVQSSGSAVLRGNVIVSATSDLLASKVRALFLCLLACNLMTIVKTRRITTVR
jgi:hypothetical protein